MTADEGRVQFHGKPGTTPQDLCRAKNISSEAKTIFALLTTYKEAYPGQEWLADHVPCSKPTVRSRLKELELHGWLKRERRNRRANETDVYHVFLSQPLPVAQREEWVVALGLSDTEIKALPKGGCCKTDYGKDITVKTLPKRDFPKIVKSSAVIKSSDSETNNIRADKKTDRKSGTFPKENYTQITEAYKRIKNVEPKGNEWLPIQKTIQLMFIDGRTPDNIIGLMEALERSDANWTSNWTINTVRLKMAEWVAGKLKLDNGESLAKRTRPGTSYQEIAESRMLSSD